MQERSFTAKIMAKRWGRFGENPLPRRTSHCSRYCFGDISDFGVGWIAITVSEIVLVEIGDKGISEVSYEMEACIWRL